MYINTVAPTDAIAINIGMVGILPPEGMDVDGRFATVEPAHGFNMASSAGSIHNEHKLVGARHEQGARPIQPV